MKYFLTIVVLGVVVSVGSACNLMGSQETIIVSDSQSENIHGLEEQVAQLRAGDILTLEDGNYRDVKLIVTALGTKVRPIIIKAANPGKVVFCGDVKVELRGEYITLQGVYFKDGNRDPREWKSHGPGLVTVIGSHNRITQCAFHCFDQANSAYIATWYDESGSFPKYCRIDHCSFTEKITFDQVINLNASKTAIKTPGAEPTGGPLYHRIDHCLFSNPKKPGNAGAGIRIGYWRYDLGRCLIDSCLFVRQDSEAEIITSKSRENVYYANTILNCRGTLNFRHGDRQVALNNFFITSDTKYEYGGMFVWGSEHLIASNYFELQTTIKSRGNAALYLNPGAEASEHALAFDIDIINNVFSNNNGYDIHFYPLEERRIQFCKENHYAYKRPYDIRLTGNVFHHSNSHYATIQEADDYLERNIQWKDNSSDCKTFGIGIPDGVEVKTKVVTETSGIDLPFQNISYPVSMKIPMPKIEGIDLDLEQLANRGVTGKPLTDKEVGPNWLKEIPGTYFYTGKLSPEVQKKFDEVTAQRSSK